MLGDIAPISPMNLTESIKAKAREIGFSKVGITDTSPLSGEIEHHYKKWIEKGYHGDLEYLARNWKDRLAPGTPLDGARSVISVAINYNPGDVPVRGVKKDARISRYALGTDYHKVVSGKLEELLAFIGEESPHPVQGKVFCDKAPFLEKAIAERAGLGWIGKHGILVTQEFGSWIFLGEIVLDMSLENDRPAENLCASCTLCMQSCPTGAIVSPGVIDAVRCISYQTVENRKDIPEQLRSEIRNWIFGCDRCQEACPYNGAVPVTKEQQFLPRPELVSTPLDMLFSVADEAFSGSFGDSAIARVKKEGFLRNIVVAMGNSGQRDFIPLLRRACRSNDPFVVTHAGWAIEKIAGRV